MVKLIVIVIAIAIAMIIIVTVIVIVVRVTVIIVIVIVVIIIVIVIRAHSISFYFLKCAFPAHPRVKKLICFIGIQLLSFLIINFLIKEPGVGCKPSV